MRQRASLVPKAHPLCLLRTAEDHSLHSRKLVQQGTRDVSQDLVFSSCWQEQKSTGQSWLESPKLFTVVFGDIPGRGRMWTHKPAPFYSDCNTRLSFFSMPFRPKGSLLHLNRLPKTHAIQFLNAGYPDLSENEPHWFIYLQAQSTVGKLFEKD